MRALLGRAGIVRSRPPAEETTTASLVAGWTYERSPVALRHRLRRLAAATRRRPAPASRVIRAAEERRRWIVYFVYAPEGTLAPRHAFTVERLRAEDAGLLLVVASPEPPSDDVAGDADAVIWKELAGFDFSAYAIALAHLASHSPGADVFVMNDSVLGPFTPLEPFWASAGWDLTALTAYARIENHIQSYAFFLRGIGPTALRALHPAVALDRAYDDFDAVVLRQETTFARYASRALTVGAFWYSDGRRCGDPSLYAARSLMESGFPVLKRGLLTKHRGLVDPAPLMRMLDAHGHPDPTA